MKIIKSDENISNFPGQKNPNNADALIKILSLPSIVPIGKKRWILLNYDSRRYFVDYEESFDQIGNNIGNEEDKQNENDIVSLEIDVPANQEEN